MKTELQNIYSETLEGCIRSAEMSTILESPFEYSNMLDDIQVFIRGEAYGDNLSFQRGRITEVNISSSIHNISDKDKNEFSEKLIDDFWKIINKI